MAKRPCDVNEMLRRRRRRAMVAAKERPAIQLPLDLENVQGRRLCPSCDGMGSDRKTGMQCHTCRGWCFIGASQEKGDRNDG